MKSCFKLATDSANLRSCPTKSSRKHKHNLHLSRVRLDSVTKYARAQLTDLYGLILLTTAGGWQFPLLHLPVSELIRRSVSPTLTTLAPSALSSHKNFSLLLITNLNLIQHTKIFEGYSTHM